LRARSNAGVIKAGNSQWTDLVLYYSLEEDMKRALITLGLIFALCAGGAMAQEKTDKEKPADQDKAANTETKKAAPQVKKRRSQKAADAEKKETPGATPRDEPDQTQTPESGKHTKAKAKPSKPETKQDN